VTVRKGGAKERRAGRVRRGEKDVTEIEMWIGE